MNYIDFIEVIGVIAFAISGALEGIRNHLDFLGVIILGIVTATGGGVIRDVLLGIVPPTSIKTGYFIYIALTVSIVAFIAPYIGRNRTRRQFRTIFENTLVITDALGLAAFTVTGMRLAYEVVPEATGFLYIFLGVLSGVGGGVIRDLLVNNIPYIMQRNVYATCSIIGAIVLHFLYRLTNLNMEIIIFISFVIIFGTRMIAHIKNWHLPKAMRM